MFEVKAHLITFDIFKNAVIYFNCGRTARGSAINKTELLFYPIRMNNYLVMLTYICGLAPPYGCKSYASF